MKITERIINFPTFTEGYWTDPVTVKRLKTFWAIRGLDDLGLQVNDVGKGERK